VSPCAVPRRVPVQAVVAPEGRLIATCPHAATGAADARSATEMACPAPTMQELTNNLLRVFGEGPVADRYPSASNAQQFYG
jgi:hypothetical protein